MKIAGPYHRIQPVDIAPLDRELLDDAGRVRVRSASDVRQFPFRELRFWMHVRAVFSYPTAELVEWLRGQLGTLPAIEIGSGNGALGRALGIPRTDAYAHQRSDHRQVMQLTKQPPIVYGDDVVKLEAGAAVARYRPHTVVAAWVTQRWRPGDDEGLSGGVDEWDLLKRVRRYIFIGSTAVHSQKRIFAKQHETLTPPWLISRSDASCDRIWIFRGQPR